LRRSGQVSFAPPDQLMVIFARNRDTPFVIRQATSFRTLLTWGDP
jgi:hypothetical protein